MEWFESGTAFQNGPRTLFRFLSVIIFCSSGLRSLFTLFACADYGRGLSKDG